MLSLDDLIISFDRGLRTVCVPAQSLRATPGGDLPETGLTESERAHAAALMRVNHSGEICAQALYQGQALTARNADARSDSSNSSEIPACPAVPSWAIASRTRSADA